MKLKITFQITILLVSYSLCQAQNPLENIIVSQEWLKSNLESDNLVLLHVGKEEDYNEGHIEGALLITPQQFAVERSSLYWELPDEKDFKKLLSEYGVTEKSTIVLYYGNEIFAATYRLYYTMEYFGWEQQTRILDGGLKGWVYNSLPVTTDKTEGPNRGKVSLEINAGVLASKEDVLNSIEKEGIKIVDARRESYYSGEKTGNYQRGGHIKSARNITWLDLVDENQFLKPTEELEALFEAAGIESDDQVITYCHVGLRASMLYTISKGLGHETKLYDGSFNEWDGLGEKYPTEGSK